MSASATQGGHKNAVKNPKQITILILSILLNWPNLLELLHVRQSHPKPVSFQHTLLDIKQRASSIEEFSDIKTKSGYKYRNESHKTLFQCENVPKHCTSSSGIFLLVLILNLLG